MTRNYFTIALLALSGLGLAQNHTKSDTLKIQQIEDVNLHKHGNPNKAVLQTGKANLSVMETPQTIAIVTHEIIEQQQAKQLSDVLQNVNGVYIQSSRGNSQDSFGGRGFSMGNDNMYKNGGRMNTGVFPEVSGLERVEVLKGANAMLYGNTSAGGIINLITKKPRFNFGGSIGMSAGSWDSYKPTIDIYGPLSSTVAYRVNGSYEYANSFRDNVNSKKSYFNPSFLFNLGKKSQLIVEADYLSHDFTPDFGIGAITNNDQSYTLNTLLPKNAFVGADWQYQNVQQVGTNVTYKTQFNDNWSMDVIGSYQNYTKDYFSTERVTWKYDTNNRLYWDRPLNRTYNEQNYTSLQANLNGSFNTGKINHKLLFGADADYNVADSYTYYDPNKAGLPKNNTFGTSYIYGTNGLATGGRIYLDDPSTWLSGAMPDSEKFEKTRNNTRRIGVYVQDFISLTNQFKVMAGLRWSYLENMNGIKTEFTKNNEKSFIKNSPSSNQALSPKLGLVYTPNQDLTVFGTYTNSFSANTGRDIEGSALAPTTIDQYELGAKKNLWNGALALNLSVYQIDYNKYYGTAQFDAAGNVNNDTTIKEYIGKMQSRGVELDMTGNPTQNLSIIAGVSYNHSVYKDTPDLPNAYIENQRLVRSPATTANLALFYKFTNQLKGLKIGAQATYTGERYAGWNDTKKNMVDRNEVTRMFKVDPFATVNISVGYDWKKFSIQGRLNNAFDTESYNIHENYSVNPITPRNVYFTLTYKL